MSSRERGLRSTLSRNRPHFLWPSKQTLLFLQRRGRRADRLVKVGDPLRNHLAEHPIVEILVLEQIKPSRSSPAASRSPAGETLQQKLPDVGLQRSHALVRHIICCAVAPVAVPLRNARCRYAGSHYLLRVCSETELVLAPLPDHEKSDPRSLLVGC